MGMFDTFYYKGREWQTKDLKRNLDKYFIADDGTVKYHEFDSYSAENAEVSNPDLSYLHGIFEGCDWVGGDCNKSGGLEYATFKFTDGVLVDFKMGR